jgi:5'-nucleotidase / UDP-sugar diphosphatase
MKKNFSLRFGSVICILITGCSFLLSQPKTITILHTNDIHAHFEPHEAFWVHQSPKPMIGGINELSFAIDSLRKINAVTLTLDAGDVMTGDPISDLEYKGADGGALFEMMDRIGYDAWCFGNHDFDISQSNLIALTKIADFPSLCANVVNDQGQLSLNNKAFIIINKGGLRIGIIGIITDDMPHLVSHENLKGLTFLSPVKTTQKYVDELTSHTDLIIALTHEGVDADSVLAMNVHGLDIIVGGHSHTRLTKPKIVNNVIIVQTGAYCENLGELTVTVDNHHVTSYKGLLIPLWYDSARPKTDLSEFIDSIQNVINKNYSQVIATLKNQWTKSYTESGEGDFICDAQREAVKADVCFANSTGIRESVPAGPLTKRELFDVLPFNDMLATFPLTGTQIKGILEYFIQKDPGVQTSGIGCEWRKTPSGGIEFVKITINGKPLDETATYTAVSSDYFVGEAKRYLGITIPDVNVLNETLFSSVEKKAEQEKDIYTKVEHRIEEVQ